MPAIAPKQKFDVLLRGRLQRTLSSASLVCGFQRAAGKRLRVLKEWEQVQRSDRRDLFIVTERGDLLDESELEQARDRRTTGEKRFLILPDATPPEALPKIIIGLRIRSPFRIHTPRLDADDRRSFLKRFMLSLEGSAEYCAIIDAWWEGEQWVVVSPTFDQLRVPLEALPKLRKASLSQRAHFEIDEYGRYVHWPELDVHMGWPQFRQAIDPRAQLRARQRSDTFNQQYGRAIRGMRQDAGLRQSQIPGLDARTIRRIEQGQTRATANALQKLASAHGMDANEYLAALADRLGAYE